MSWTQRVAKDPLRSIILFQDLLNQTEANNRTDDLDLQFGMKDALKSEDRGKRDLP